MQVKWKQIGVCLLAALMLTGCRPSGGGQDESTGGITGQATNQSTTGTTGGETETTGETTEMTTETSTPIVIGPGLIITDPGKASTSVEAAQIRLSGSRSDGWGKTFATNNGAFLMADSAEALSQGLTDKGINTDDLALDAYDAAFFAANRLVVIPCRSGSGSVRYEAGVVVDGTTLTVTLDGKLPGEMGTSDMADWLVLVVLPREQYPEGTVISVPDSYTGSGSGLATH